MVFSKINISSHQQSTTKYLYQCYMNTYSHQIISHMHKFSRDVIFADYPNLGFPRFYFHGSLVITLCTSNFVDDN